MMKMKVLLCLEKSGRNVRVCICTYVCIMHISAHECVCEYICGCKRHSLKALEAKLSTDVLTSCTVPFNYQNQKQMTTSRQILLRGSGSTQRTTPSTWFNSHWQLITNGTCVFTALCPCGPGPEVGGLIGLMPTRAHWTVVPWRTTNCFYVFCDLIFVVEYFKQIQACSPKRVFVLCLSQRTQWNKAMWDLHFVW